MWIYAKPLDITCVKDVGSGYMAFFVEHTKKDRNSTTKAVKKDMIIIMNFEKINGISKLIITFNSYFIYGI